MVLDPRDPNRRSCGSFFTNPIVSAADCARVEALARDPAMPRWVQPNGRVKLSAAWLIERAGFRRGDADRAVGLSTRHTLAVVAHEGAQALARGLWSLSLGELGLFRRYLALSSRVVELEAVDAELEAARLDLWLRRLTLRLTEAPGADPIERPAPAPFACARYPVGRIEFLSCRGPLTP